MILYKGMKFFRIRLGLRTGRSVPQAGGPVRADAPRVPQAGGPALSGPLAGRHPRVLSRLAGNQFSGRSWIGCASWRNSRSRQSSRGRRSYRELAGNIAARAVLGGDGRYRELAKQLGRLLRRCARSPRRRSRSQQSSQLFGESWDERLAERCRANGYAALRTSSRNATLSLSAMAVEELVPGCGDRAKGMQPSVSRRR